MGEFGIYPPDGFAATFGNYSNNTLDLIKTLNYNNWIDLRTCSLILEFLIFNPQNLYFSYGVHLFEFFGGNIFTNGAISTVKLDIYTGTNSIYIIIFQVLCLLSILTFVGFVIYAIFNTKKFYKV